MLAAGADLAGFSTFGDDIWVGLGTTVKNDLHIGNGARLNIGSVVVTDVAADAAVSGNYAMEHTRFLYEQIKLRREQ